MVGRPPKPLEIKRKTGSAPGRDTGGRKLPDATIIATLPMADGVPDPPIDFRLEAKHLWEQVWERGITWISPASDFEAVKQVCRLADDLEIARERYRVTREPSDARVVVDFSKAVMSGLSALGFDPTARSRLGVAEVKRASALDELIQRRAQ